MQSRISLRLPDLARQFGRDRLGGQAGWVAAPYAVTLGIRLVTQIVLAWLLAPEMFGLMMLVNALRTGIEQLSDIGVGQSVVRSPHAHDDAFLNTAWTLQVLRGLLLTAVAVAVAWPISRLYGNPDLFEILLMASTLFLFTGLLSPNLFLIQRDLRLRARAIYDVVTVLFQCVLTVVLAALVPTVWALVWGLVLSTLFGTLFSYAFGRTLPRFAWQREHVREILHFGKWIFLASAVYFAATSFDRVYFAAELPLALAGVYAVARTFSDMFGQLALRAGQYVVFPRMAALSERRHEAAAALRTKRFRVLALAALGIALAIAGSDAFILLFYDDRYHAAAFMLPLLLVGGWFGVLAAFADAMLMGCSRPAPVATGNALKFAVMLVGLPLTLAYGSLLGALLVLVLAELVRWGSLTIDLQKERLATISDDLALTVLVIAAALAAKFALGAVGLVPTLGEWWALGQSAHG